MAEVDNNDGYISDIKSFKRLNGIAGFIATILTIAGSYLIWETLPSEVSGDWCTTVYGTILQTTPIGTSPSIFGSSRIGPTQV